MAWMKNKLDKIYMKLEERSILEKLLLIFVSVLLLGVVILIVICATQLGKSVTSEPDFDFIYSLPEAKSDQEFGPLTAELFDVGEGKPARNVKVQLHFMGPKGNMTDIAMKRTGFDGRAVNLISKTHFIEGLYKIRFDTQEYFDQQFKTSAIYSFIETVVEVKSKERNFHLLVQITKNSYSISIIQ